MTDQLECFVLDCHEPATIRVSKQGDKQCHLFCESDGKQYYVNALGGILRAYPMKKHLLKELGIT